MEKREQNGYWEMLINRSVQRFFLLAGLHERPMHGYELARAIRDACAGCCQPTDAMIYPALHDLISEGQVVCREVTVGGRRRKVCSLTEKGEEAYREAALAWQRMLGPLAEAVNEALKCCPATADESGALTKERV
ncbi:MAG: PadR family transcriptional regulator [Dehalococcoidia bacterium]|nr:PadR family transcriptional regulator [Dehalococcoidia bacterium]